MLFKTREVFIGSIALGGDNEVRLQTMTNTGTADVESTVMQCKRIFHTGVDYIRVTVPSLKDVAHFKSIKEKLLSENINVPLIADVHFNPRVAEEVAVIADKVRINPGNYADRNSAKTQFTDEEYHNELAKIKTNLLPLVQICRQNKTAIRVGTNHGSLSPRIMARYGDTPEGMAESAMEFLRILHGEGFHDIVLSMKASNTLVMIHATRLLVKKMIREQMMYPIHLGVTEAGEGEDGRIKSALGIGTLLLDGIGDTIRVSLSEDPEEELPVAGKIKSYCTPGNKKNMQPAEFLLSLQTSFNRRKTHAVAGIGGENPPVVIGSPHNQQPPDIIFHDDIEPPAMLNSSQLILLPHDQWLKSGKEKGTFPLLYPGSFSGTNQISPEANFMMVDKKTLDHAFIERLSRDETNILVLSVSEKDDIREYLSFFHFLGERKISTPVILKLAYNEPEEEFFMIKSSIDAGYLFTNGFCNGLWLENNTRENFSNLTPISYSILQACRQRFSKTEYITCPSCGRTRFNLPETIKKVKQHTSHLKDLKIAIMGCIVNGPGEMADADYGYVGSGIGKITLYKGKEIVKRNIPEENAVDELTKLIKKSGDWNENPSTIDKSV